MTPISSHIFAKLADRAGYLAAWPAVYLLSASSLLADLASLPQPTPAAAVMLVGIGLSVYLIDRVKIADCFLDPADAVTHPARHEWLWQHRMGARTLAVLAAVLASVAGGFIHPLLIAAPLAGQLGVFAYSGNPSKHDGGRVRLKDIPFIKNLAASVGIVSIAAIAVHIPNEAPFNLGAFDAIGVVAILVFADCALCDVGDEVGDRTHGTRTLAVLFGPDRTRVMASAMALCAAGLAWQISHSLVWAVAIAGTQVVLACLPARLVRNATDLRLPALAGVILLVSCVKGHILAP